MSYGHAEFLLIKDEWLAAARQEIEEDQKNDEEE